MVILFIIYKYNLSSSLALYSLCLFCAIFCQNPSDEVLCDILNFLYCTYEISNTVKPSCLG